jgi:16S rRNA (adenine1518-N6/adenine1519-N6)-dimethyltransferase
MSAIDGLPKLSDVIATHGLDAKKALGQNFLLDLNITQKIAKNAAPFDKCTVLEIGPGPGGLTRALLANGAQKLVVVERDERCLPALQEIAAHYPDRLTIIEGDALEFNPYEEIEGDFKIVANLPYNVATPLLTNWLGHEPWPERLLSMTLMFQKEVAERICAKVGDKHYGRLGVLCSLRTEAQILFNLSPQAFTPPPKVTSSVVHLVPKTTPIPCELSKLETITKSAFGQRRKMLRQSLKPIGGAELLEKAGIEGDRRAENLSLEEFIMLANSL